MAGKTGFGYLLRTGKFLLPGLTDAHVHFRDPGFLEKEDWETGSAAALAGGVTTVLDMPNTMPATTTVEALEAKRTIALAKSKVQFGLFFGATRDNLEEIRRAENICGINSSQRRRFFHRRSVQVMDWHPFCISSMDRVLFYLSASVKRLAQRAAIRTACNG